LNDDREHAGESASLARFWKPRHWPAWGLWLWMRLNAALPLRIALAIHRPIGKALYRLAPKIRRLVHRNLEICFPDLDSAAVERLAKRQFEALAMSIAECAAAWLGRDVPGRFEIIGVEHLNAAVANGKGALLYTGHFTPLDICGAAFEGLAPLYAAMISHRSSPVLDELQRRGRARHSHELIPSDSVRSLLKFLKRNGVVWYAPDLAYREGELMPFFGEPAMTNIATSKIARMSGATVLPYQYRRIEGSARYQIRIYPPLDAFPSDDPVADTRRLTTFLEQFIRDAPEQYQWIHKRFKWRPVALPDLYAKPRRS
jgi:Kdo2-lipid IVA lauroyltransferase/acyltransferase